jgi:hypothetical protein
MKFKFAELALEANLKTFYINHISVPITGYSKQTPPGTGDTCKPVRTDRTERYGNSTGSELLISQASETHRRLRHKALETTSTQTPVGIHTPVKHFEKSTEISVLDCAATGIACTHFYIKNETFVFIFYSFCLITIYC